VSLFNVLIKYDLYGTSECSDKDEINFRFDKNNGLPKELLCHLTDNNVATNYSLITKIGAGIANFPGYTGLIVYKKISFVRKNDRIICLI
jgi:hypothetical protein